MSTITLERARSSLSPKSATAIREVMREMLVSPHFSKSKRYPVLLEYCIENTLKCDFCALKERVIGSDVFGRPANYDSNEDPIVRITAGEVRKRISLYFDEHRDSPVRIDLPLGSYICTFQFKEEPSASLSLVTPEPAPALLHSEISGEEHGAADDNDSRSCRRFIAFQPRVAFACAVIICAVAVLGILEYLHVKKEREFWWPAFQKDVPAMIVVGQGNRGVQDSATMSSLPSTLIVEANRPQNQVEMANAIATAEICGVFRQFKRACTIVPARTATPAELHHKSVVLVGGFDNPWTERMLAPLRFHLDRVITPDYPAGGLLSIDDRDRKANGSQWSVDRSISLDQMKSDYLIIARFRNDATDDDVFVAAGVWTLGTQIAGEYVASPEKMARIISLAPAGWKGFNFEAVLQTDVVGGEAGNVRVLATDFW